jgi:cytochrome c5
VIRAIALLGLVAACRGPWLPVATEADATRSNAAVADLNRGRQLLIHSCSGCHLTPSPRDHRAADWPSEVAEMRERSKLDADEVALITQYLTAFAEQR